MQGGDLPASLPVSVIPRYPVLCLKDLHILKESVCPPSGLLLSCPEWCTTLGNKAVRASFKTGYSPEISTLENSGSFGESLTPADICMHSDLEPHLHYVSPLLRKLPRLPWCSWCLGPSSIPLLDSASCSTDSAVHRWVETSSTITSCVKSFKPRVTEIGFGFCVLYPPCRLLSTQVCNVKTESVSLHYLQDRDSGSSSTSPMLRGGSDPL